VAAACVWARERLEALVDGGLDPARSARLRAHLAECPDCRAHHAEACSLPTRLAALPSPEPPRTLVAGVLRSVRREHVPSLHLWGPLGIELTLCVVALWYVSGLGGLYQLAQRTSSEVGGLLAWGAGQAELPPPPVADAFLLLVCGLLVVTSVCHLVLLFRQSPRVLA
jgi:predicted anti-sigma-YlaC factor YlaD